MTQKIVPHLWFDKEAEAAARFYVSLFEYSEIKNIARYGKAGAEVSGEREGSVMTVQFTLAGMEFGAINGGPLFKFTPAISLFVACETPGEVDRLYQALLPGGSVLMPLDAYPFSRRYAWITDRYGLSWQLYTGGSPQKITPCLMFVNEQYGRAMEAIMWYSGVFGPSPVENLTFYAPDEGERPGAVKHAEWSIEGCRFMVMDSGYQHQFSFTPALSFMVRSKNQEEIDRLWTQLSAVPDAEACGWLQDRFGVSWQIVPADLSGILNVENPVKSEKVMKTMFRMKKLEIEALKNAAL